MNGKAKVALLALVAAVVAVPVSGTYAAEDKDSDPAGTKTIQEFKHEIALWLAYEGKDKKSVEAKIAELKTKYETLFKAVIEEIRVATDTRDLTDAEILAAIDYIVYETIKDEKRKIARENAANSNADGVAFLGLLGIPVADAACPATTDPKYRQLRIDIDGGLYKSASFNGDNELYFVRTAENSRTCEKTYELHFRDEDHPVSDRLYDSIRSVLYGRVHDIESFTIENNRVIRFDGVWSSTHDYSAEGVFHLHLTTAKAYMPGQTIYVSNTWNHIMDTLDTNSSLAKKWVP